jgi:hypothetical protein
MTMQDRMAARLAELRQEYRTGEMQLRELAQQEMTLRETLLRISGAIQVLEELSDAASVPEPAPTANRDAPMGKDEGPGQDPAGDRGPVLTVP